MRKCALHHLGGVDLGEQHMEGGGLVVPVERVVVRLPRVQLVIVHGGSLQVLVLLSHTANMSTVCTYHF